MVTKFNRPGGGTEFEVIPELASENTQNEIKNILLKDLTLIHVLDYATLTVSSASVSLASDAVPTLPANCNRAFISCRVFAVSWRPDGTDPVAVTDHVLAANDAISFTQFNYRQLLENIRFIADTATAGTLQITYFD